ncbi:hypothetical protein [Acuticoccus kandeliae]|nr:hypothetical protein [Acuticoccus kandeliae]
MDARVALPGVLSDPTNLTGVVETSTAAPTKSPGVEEAGPSGWIKPEPR